MPHHRSIRSFLTYAAYFLAALVLGWGFTPYKDVFLGLILGAVIGFLNLVILYIKIQRVVKAAIKGKKVRSLGMLSRFALAGLAVLIVMAYPDVFNLVAVVIGLVAAYLIMIVDHVFQILHSSRK